MKGWQAFDLKAQWKHCHFTFHLCVLCECAHVQVPKEARMGHWMPWHSSQKHLLSHLKWVLGTKPGSSAWVVVFCQLSSLSSPFSFFLRIGSLVLRMTSSSLWARDGLNSWFPSQPWLKYMSPSSTIIPGFMWRWDHSVHDARQTLPT